jgi:hypothetical protein
MWCAEIPNAWQLAIACDDRPYWAISIGRLLAWLSWYSRRKWRFWWDFSYRKIILSISTVGRLYIFSWQRLADFVLKLTDWSLTKFFSSYFSHLDTNINLSYI